MMARQPLSKEPARFSGLPYTGVKYEEPHLLPCTVCRRTAPADYQAKMFSVESLWPVVADVVSQRFDALLREHRLSDLNALLEYLLSIPTPRRHAASLPLLQLEWRMKHCLFLRGSVSAKTVHDALSKYFACLENLFPHPHKEVSEALTTAAVLCCDAHFPSVFPPQQQKELCQKAVRMHLLIHGRGMRHALLEDTTAGVLEKLPQNESTEVCAFCAESLVDAPFLPRLCSNCKQVAYCSAGCQKAHWRLHKKTCKSC